MKRTQDRGWIGGLAMLMIPAFHRLALAHPGHGDAAADVLGIIHYLTEPLHLWGSVGTTAALIVLVISGRLRTRWNDRTRRDDGRGRG